MGTCHEFRKKENDVYERDKKDKWKKGRTRTHFELGGFLGGHFNYVLPPESRDWQD